MGLLQHPLSKILPSKTILKNLKKSHLWNSASQSNTKYHIKKPENFNRQQDIQFKKMSAAETWFASLTH